MLPSCSGIFFMPQLPFRPFPLICMFFCSWTACTMNLVSHPLCRRKNHESKVLESWISTFLFFLYYIFFSNWSCLAVATYSSSRGISHWSAIFEFIGHNCFKLCGIIMDAFGAVLTSIVEGIQCWQISSQDAFIFFFFWVTFNFYNMLIW